MKQFSEKNRFKMPLFVAVVAVCAALLLPGDTALLPSEDGALLLQEDAAPLSSGDAAKLSEGDPVYEIDGSIVMVRVGKPAEQVLYASGSGVVYAMSEKELWIVTAGHVLEHVGDGAVWVDFAGAADGRATDETGGDTQSAVRDETGAAAVVQCDAYELTEDADLAFLCISLESIPGGIRDQLILPGTDKERYDALGESDAVRVRGFGENGLVSYDGILTESWIYVEDFAQYMMVADCALEPGMSGGGLFDDAGNLIGIACGGNESGELAAVPLHVVQARFADAQGSVK